jgi:threonine synthase
VALAVCRKLVERKIIRSNQRVVVISTAHGLKFADQKTAYHLGQIDGVGSTYANHPVEIAADLRQVNDTIKRYADKIKLMEA